MSSLGSTRVQLGALHNNSEEKVRDDLITILSWVHLGSFGFTRVHLGALHVNYEEIFVRLGLAWPGLAWLGLALFCLNSLLINSEEKVCYDFIMI